MEIVIGLIDPALGLIDPVLGVCQAITIDIEQAIVRASGVNEPRIDALGRRGCCEHTQRGECGERGLANQTVTSGRNKLMGHDGSPAKAQIPGRLNKAGRGLMPLRTAQFALRRGEGHCRHAKPVLQPPSAPEAHFAYRASSASPITVRFAWTTDGQRQSADHTYSAGAGTDATWNLDAGKKVETVWVEYGVR